MSCVGNSNKKVIQANADSITVAKKNIPLDVDSLRILKELYGGSEILQSIDIGNFTEQHTFDSSKKQIKVSCIQNSANHKLTYVAIFKDTAKIYSESQFVPLILVVASATSRNFIERPIGVSINHKLLRDINHWTHYNYGSSMIYTGTDSRELTSGRFI
jgi:hypothetical protein